MRTIIVRALAAAVVASGFILAAVTAAAPAQSINSTSTPLAIGVLPGLSGLSNLLGGLLGGQ